MIWTSPVSSSSIHDRDDVELLGRVGRVVALEDVDDDHRDVVATAGCVGGVDACLRGGLWVVGVSVECVEDLVVGDVVGEAVAAEHEAIAADDRHRPRIDPDRRFDAEGSGDDVAAGMGARLVAGDRAFGDELLHEGVIDRDLAEPAVAQHVAAGVADVDDAERFAVVRVGDDGDRGDGRAHPGLVGVGDRALVDVGVGVVDRLHQIVERALRLGARGQLLAEVRHRHLARDLAGEVAAHAVGDDEQARTGEHVVLVLRPELPGVGRRAPAQLGHQRSPLLTRAPPGSCSRSGSDRRCAAACDRRACHR